MKRVKFLGPFSRKPIAQYAAGRARKGGKRATVSRCYTVIVRPGLKRKGR